MDINQKLNSMDEQLEMLANEITRDEGCKTVSRIVGVVGINVKPGSYKGGDVKVEFAGKVLVTGSVLERIELAHMILKDIPLAHWRTVMAAIYDMQHERMEFEISNEPNGITPPLGLDTEKEVSAETPTDNRSLTKKIRDTFLGKSEEVEGE